MTASAMVTTGPACTACGHAFVRQDPFYYDWKGSRYWIYRCAQCTHQFVNPSVTANEQAEIYGDRYFSAGGDWVCGMFAGGYHEAEAALREEAAEILDLFPVKSGRLLDVGCAGGVFLDEARKRGLRVAGIELNAAMAESARRNYGLDVFTGRIEDVPPASFREPFDVVTLLDCLEHIPEPLQAVRKVAAWLRSRGYLFLRGPLSNNPAAVLRDNVRRVLGITKQLPGYPLDANMFNKRSLSSLLDRAGLDVLSWPGESERFSNVIARKR